MKCKFCGAELDEGVLVCPACGKDSAETPVEETAAGEVLPVEAPAETAEETQQLKPSKKKKWIRLTAIICCAVLVLGLCAGAWYDFNGGWIPGDNDIHFRSNYTRGTWGVKLAADRVAATIEDRELTNEQLQIFYWMQFHNNYSSSTTLNMDEPLANQKFPSAEGEEEISWEQYFLRLGLETWHSYQTLVIAAEKAGFEMPEDYSTMLEETPADLEESAKELGYKDADEFLHTMFGPGGTMEAYLYVTDLIQRGSAYYAQWYEEQDPTRDEVSAFFDEYAEEFSSVYGVTKETGKLVDVRHILIRPEGATVDTSGKVTATDDQWEQCRAQAQAMLDDWAKDGTEEAFAKLANEKSTDGGSNTNGGLYSGVPKGYMVENFDAWIFEEGRETGDTGLVRTEFGYHIMYYVGGDEAWYLYGRDQLIADLCSKKLTALVEATPMEVNYKAVVLGKADLDRYDS